jgi:ATP-binding cassette, subfamily C, bacterial
MLRPANESGPQVTSPNEKTPSRRPLRYLRIFTATPPLQQATLLACLILASVAEGIGIATLLPILSLVDTTGTAAGSNISRAVVNAIATIGLTPNLGTLLLIVVAGMMIKAALTVAAMTYVAYTVAEVTTGLRLTLIDSLMKVRWAYFAKQPVGRFANAISGEATRAGEAYLAVAQLIAVVLQTIIYIALAALISWRFTLVALAIGLAMSFVLSRFTRMTRRAGRHQTKRTKKLVAQLSDALIGIKPLKAMARHVRLSRLFHGDVESLNQALRRQALARQATRSLQEPITILFLAASFWIAVDWWHLPVTAVLVSIALMGRTLSSLGKIQQQLQSVYASDSAYWSIHDTIAKAGREREIIIGTRVPTLKKGCELRGVSFAYGRKGVLDNVSLSIPAGRLTTITGASGAGKTTVADLLLGLHRPASGEVFIDGLPLAEIDLLRWRGMVGYVPQEVILFHDTIFANVTLGEPELTEADVRKALEEAGAWDFVAQIPDGLEAIVGERGTMLSGGQRQRIALARALIHQPQLLILDEATSALDPETELAICRNVKALGLRRHLTVIAITHQPSWVAAADQVYRLEDQRVVQHGPVPSLVRLSS